jgi:hypothetical protein
MDDGLAALSRASFAGAASINAATLSRVADTFCRLRASSLGPDIVVRQIAE